MYFVTSLDEIKVIFMTTTRIFLFIIYKLKRLEFNVARYRDLKDTKIINTNVYLFNKKKNVT